MEPCIRRNAGGAFHNRKKFRGWREINICCIFLMLSKTKAFVLAGGCWKMVWVYFVLCVQLCRLRSYSKLDYKQHFSPCSFESGEVSLCMFLSEVFTMVYISKAEACGSLWKRLCPRCVIKSKHIYIGRIINPPFCFHVGYKRLFRARINIGIDSRWHVVALLESEGSSDIFT